MGNNMQCNCCGKYMKFQQDIPMEDYVVVRKQWGYFSGKDGEMDQFVLCEACYDKMIENFKIPIKREIVMELL